MLWSNENVHKTLVQINEMQDIELEISFFLSEFVHI